jgi:hypothetical protein
MLSLLFFRLEINKMVEKMISKMNKISGNMAGVSGIPLSINNPTIPTLIRKIERIIFDFQPIMHTSVTVYLRRSPAELLLYGS